MLTLRDSELFFCLLCAPISVASAPSVVNSSLPTSPQTEKPGWCKPLPRPEYKTVQRITVSDPWFEVYRVATNTIAIYEPHQSEETISYLILGKDRALLLDTGMGISDIRKVTSELTSLPIIVVNSHTHDDHVGGNWQFPAVYSMDTDFSRSNAKGSTADAQAEIAPGEICGDLPKNFDAKGYHTKPWAITKYLHDGDTIDLGGRTMEILSTPGHTPDAICLFDRTNGLLFTGDTYYPAAIWLYRPETDLAAYAKSIARLAALAPQVKIVLGQHNVPVAPPSVLPHLVDAFAALQAGKGVCKPAGEGKRLCQVGDFSFLLHAAPLSSRLVPAPRMAMVLRAFSLFSAACLLLLAATPQVGDAQPPREKSVWNYDGGVQLVTDGAIANGPCFRLTGRLKAPQFFDNLRRVDTSTGTLFRRGNEIVTEFPERMELSFELYDLPCSDRFEDAGATSIYLNKAILRTLHVNFYWKRGLSVRPAPEIMLKHAEMIPIEPFARGLSSEPLPVKYEWWFQFDVPSAGVPVTDSLVLVMLSPQGKIVARCAARM